MVNTNPVKGTQDIFGDYFYIQDNLISTLKKIFTLHGFEPLSTPAMEYTEILTSNYEDEEKLIYHILNSGSLEKSLNIKKFQKKDISEKGLRYDLTVPMIRFIANNFSELKIPFKRFQIQEVWRADRPQKGRFREFLQCDIDIVGSKSFFCEIELLSIAYDFFNKIAPKKFSIYINDIALFKKILGNFNLLESFQEIFIAVDKIDKVGLSLVIKNLRDKKYPEDFLKLIEELFSLKELPLSFCIKHLNEIIIEFPFLKEESLKFLEKINELRNYIDENFIKIDLLLGRGLGYYTSLIFEVKPNDKSIGSVLGGGRYNGMLTKTFPNKKLSFPDTAAGMSFGISRIISYLKEKNLKVNNCQPEKILITPLVQEGWRISFDIQKFYHKQFINSEIITEFSSLKKALSFADKNNFSKIIIIGENEIESEKVLLKNLKDGSQSYFLFSYFLKD